MKNQYRKIPIALCQYALQNRLIRTLQVYTYLNFSFSGKAKLPYSEIEKAAKELNLSTRTIQNHIKILLALNWLGYNPKSKIYFIRSIDQLRRFLALPARSAAVLYQSNIRDYKAFCVAAVLGNLVNYQKRRRGRFFERSRGRSRQKDKLRLYYPISLSVIAKILKTDISTASRYKHMSQKAGFIQIKPSFELITNDLKAFKALNYIDELKGKLRIRNNGIYCQGPDQLCHLLHFKKRRKLFWKKMQTY